MTFILFQKNAGKDSNKKCNGYSPYSTSGEGRAPRGLSKPPLSALQSKVTSSR